MTEFARYRRTAIAEMRPFVPGEDLSNITINPKDMRDHGCPKVGDLIARDPADHESQWLVSKEYFERNFERASD